ncbi:unnamed protein product [Amaranthus hypochondriacus]
MESCIREEEYKQGWRNQTFMSSISTLPFHLVAIFVIVILLLFFSSSSHADYKAHQLEHNLGFMMFLFPLIVMVILGFLLMNGGFYSQLVSNSKNKLALHSTTICQTAVSFPWGVGVLVVVVLLLLSYQSSVQARWF